VYSPPDAEDFAATDFVPGKEQHPLDSDSSQTAAFKTAALRKGYAFAASDEGWNRLTIADRPQDNYYESRQRIREVTLQAKEVLMLHYGRAPSRTLMMGGSNAGHHTK
jgi:hypothetical protein